MRLAETFGKKVKYKHDETIYYVFSYSEEDKIYGTCYRIKDDSVSELATYIYTNVDDGDWELYGVQDTHICGLVCKCDAKKAITF